jgi:hypothetical protein
MKTRKDPTWWNTSHDSAWERVKAAFKRDWDQTKHDFGGSRPDTDQDVPNTIRQAAGKEAIPPRGVPTYEEDEDAYRFGYGAREHYGTRYPEWDERLEAELRRDWDDADPDWERHRSAIRRGWDYRETATRL